MDLEDRAERQQVAELQVHAAVEKPRQRSMADLQRVLDLAGRQRQVSQSQAQQRADQIQTVSRRHDGKTLCEGCGRRKGPVRERRPWGGRRWLPRVPQDVCDSRVPTDSSMPVRRLLPKQASESGAYPIQAMLLTCLRNSARIQATG